MRAAVLFLIVSFATFAAAQSTGGASAGGSTAGSGMTTSGSGSSPTGAASGTTSPGLITQPAAGPASVAPTGNLGPSTTQPNGASNAQATGSATGTTVNTGGFITNAPVTSGGAGNSGYVPLLQTPSVSWPSPLSSDLPIAPAGISNSPSALVYSNLPSGGNRELPPTTTGVEESLGEVARQYRSRQQQASRVYTNADIANLDRQQPGSSIGPQGNTANQAGTQASPAPTTPSMNQQPNSSLPAGDSQGTTPQTPR